MASSPTPSSAQVRRVSGRKKLNSALSRSMLSVTAYHRTCAAALTPPARPRARRSSRPTRRARAARRRSARPAGSRPGPRGRAPLHAPAAAVDQPDLAEARLQGGFEVGLHDRRDLARREGVQVERVLDRYDDGAAHGRAVVDRAYLETGMGAACPAGTASAYAMT